MILNTASQIPVTLSSSAVYQQQGNRPSMQSGQGNPKPENTLPMLDGAISLTEIELSKAGSSQTNSKLARRIVNHKKNKG